MYILCRFFLSLQKVNFYDAYWMTFNLLALVFFKHFKWLGKNKYRYRTET